MERRLSNLVHDPLTLDELALRGDDLVQLGICPGPRIGHILTILLDIVTEYPQKNTWSQLIGYAKELKKCINPEKGGNNMLG